MENVKVAIIGGGMTGLAAAFKLEQAKASSPIEYDLYEKEDKLGGKIQTERINGFVIERGPDSFLARKTSMSRLAKEVGLGDELLSNNTGQAYILKDKELHPIPKGAVMGVPTEIKPFMQSKLFSTKAKARAAADLVLPKVSETDVDISLGHFFRSRLGDDVVDHLIEPLLSGIYAGNLDKLSLQATFPQFQQMEEQHRSLIRGIRASRVKQKTTSNEKNKKGLFLTFKRGLQSFVEAIEQRLEQSAIYKNTNVQAIRRQGDRYALTFADGSTKQYDYVIIATPAHVTAKLLSEYEYFDYLARLEATSVANVAIAFKEGAIENNYDGTGFVVPTKSEYTITACTWTNKKWEHSTPPGYTLIRLYVGKPDDSKIVDEDDEVIVETALQDLRQIMTINDDPEFYKVTRWKKAMPQYHVGHKYKINKINEDVARHLPNLFLCGAAFEGVGLPDCIDQGEKVAELIINDTKNHD